jgi:hypothetical protein
VILESTGGIAVYGSIETGDLKISADGNFRQSYTDTFFNVAGSPRAIWGSFAKYYTQGKKVGYPYRYVMEIDEKTKLPVWVWKKVDIYKDIINSILNTPPTNQIKADNIFIAALPSCNLYLMGRKDKQPIRRGVTRVKDFLKAGVNIAYASDNIRDPFRPYGNADMLEEGLLTAQVLQMGTPSELETVFRMGTYNPAKILGLKNYGTQVGCKADLVLLEAASPSEALISQATKAYVFKNGKPVAKTIKQQILL